MTAKSYFSKKGKQKKLSKMDVLYIVGNGNYCKLFLVTGEIILMAHTLKRYQKHWPELIRIHKQVMINSAHAIGFNLEMRLRDFSYIIMKDNSAHRISRNRLAFCLNNLNFLPKISLSIDKSSVSVDITDTN